MDFKLSIDMDNLWFCDEPEMAVASILNGVQSRLQHGEIGGRIMDGNGNTCGKWDIDTGRV